MSDSDFFGFEDCPYIWQGSIGKQMEITNKDAIIRTFMHYSDHDAHKEVTVFGSRNDWLRYNYSDRLSQWDCDKWRAGLDIAKSQGLSPQTARYYEVALSHFHDSPCDLQHIILGCNRSNGFHYLIFGFTCQEKPTTKDTE